jgi:hypothetical protein
MLSSLCGHRVWKGSAGHRLINGGRSRGPLVPPTGKRTHDNFADMFRMVLGRRFRTGHLVTIRSVR